MAAGRGGPERKVAAACLESQRARPINTQELQYMKICCPSEHTQRDKEQDAERKRKGGRERYFGVHDELEEGVE